MIDLHSHSTASDGAFAPARLIAEAAARGVTTLALTDHDTVHGLLEAEAAAVEHGVTLVPGVEFTVVCAGIEVHLLGLGIDRGNGKLTALCDDIRGRRRDRFFGMVERLRMAGVPLSTLDVDENVSLARPYLARMLVQQGFSETYQDAFHAYLKKGGPAYVEHRAAPIRIAIDAIHAAEGVAILAHPGLYRNSDEVIFEAVQQGIDGIECFHSDHDHNATEHYLALARKLNLLVSGGADFHGPDHKRARLFGRKGLPAEHFERLKERMQAVRHEKR